MPGHKYPTRRKVKRSCGKRRYRDEIAAKFALAQIANRDRSSAKATGLECRAYKCPGCHGWHLTSQAKRER